MSARSYVVRFLVHTGMVVGAILAVTILLAAMPGHHAPSVEAIGGSHPETPQSTSLQMPGMDQAHTAQKAQMDQMGMDGDEHGNEQAAMNDMAHMRGGPHMHMTEMRTQSPMDKQRANEIVTQLRAGIEKYRDYHIALNDGFRIFLPEVPQPEYHFTSFKNGFSALGHFEPKQPTSLLYRKTADGYELVGAMYTMPKRASEEQLNERVPLSIAVWHLHTNLCMPAKAQGHNADWTKFGLKGSISTLEACDAAGGNFHPSIFGWMVHVYPYQTSLDKIFAMHHQD